MSKVADVRASTPDCFDPDLKEANGGFFVSRWMNTDAIDDFFKGAVYRPTSNWIYSSETNVANLSEELNALDNLDQFKEISRNNP